MRLQDVLSLTQAQFFELDLTPVVLNREVRLGFGADLMSDVLRYDVAQGLMITGLVNPQIVRTAEMADAAAILIVRGKIPPPETSDLAGRVGIPIMGTEMSMFEACGRLYQTGLPPARRHDEVG
jgi:hypothetical protein